MPPDADADELPRWTENRPRTGLRLLDLPELWEFRELIGFLALRDLKVRYKQAAFGIAWAVLQPVAGMAILTIVFRQLADVPSDGIPYPAFALLGYAIWTYFSSSLNAVTDSFVGNAALVSKIYFPRLGAPIAAVLPGLVDLGVALVVVAGFMVVYGIVPTAAIVTLPLWIVAVVAVALGAGLPLATLNVRYRDAHHGFALLTQLWFFASPVAYPSSLVHGTWRYLYYLNPVAGILDGFRWSMLAGPRPPAVAALSLATTALLLPIGLRYFLSSERRFADII